MEENVKLVYVQKTDKRYFKTDPIWQYDVGHVLDLHEFDTLPETFQVHFSHNPSGDAVTQIGQNGACSVPDSFVQVAKTIYAWIYVATEDTGLTKYFIEMPVARKSSPSDQEPEPVEQSAIDQAIAALNAGVDRAEDAADAAEAAQTGAEAAEQGASTAQQTAQAAAQTAAGKVAEAAAQVNLAKQEADRAETAAQNAEGSATAAAGSATSAASFAQSATSASQAAAQSARATAQAGAEADRDAKAAAASAATAASEAANAAQSASQAEHTVQDASAQADRAEQAADDAEAAKTGAETARTGAETAQTAAAGSASAAAGSATAAQTSAGNAASSATAAAGSAQAAAQTAAQFEEDITSLKSDIQAKQNAPQTPGTPGQVFGLDDNLDPVWVTPTDAVTPDGTFEDLTAGNALEVLSDRGTSDNEPYLFRKAVGWNRAKLNAIVGVSVPWNQLYKQSNGTVVNNGITFTIINGRISVSGVNDGSSSSYCTFRFINPPPANHVILFGGVPGTGAANTYDITLTNTAGSVAAYTGWKIAKKSGEYQMLNIDIRANYDADTNPLVFVPQAFDLTKIFGSDVADYLYNLETATPGAGVAVFRNWFPNDYYPYNPGDDLISVSGLQSRDTVGFNQWDEEWESGQFYGITSTVAITKASDSTRIRSKNDIAVLPDTAYYLKSNQPLFAYYLDENGTWLNVVGSNGTTLAKNSVFTTPANCRYMRFFTINTTAYNHDICINISDPSRNGTYKPYVKHSYPLDSSLTLRGVPKLVDNKLTFDGDRYLPDGTVGRRYGVVDMGTLTWQYFSDSNPPHFGATVQGLKRATDNIMCSAYEAIRGNPYANKDKTIRATDQHNVQGIKVNDTAYTDAAAFKTAMSGVYLVYELATPTTETAQPYRELQIQEKGGSEGFVSNAALPVPVGHETFYPVNVFDYIDEAIAAALNA